jgi:hypothetical protein
MKMHPRRDAGPGVPGLLAVKRVDFDEEDD